MCAMFSFIIPHPTYPASHIRKTWRYLDVEVRCSLYPGKNSPPITYSTTFVPWGRACCLLHRDALSRALQAAANVKAYASLSSQHGGPLSFSMAKLYQDSSG